MSGHLTADSLHGLALGLATRPEPDRARARVIPGEAGAPYGAQLTEDYFSDVSRIQLVSPILQTSFAPADAAMPHTRANAAIPRSFIVTSEGIGT